MNTLKKIIITLIILALIVLFMIIYMLMQKSITNESEINENDISTDQPLQIEQNIKKVTSKDLFCIIEKCAQKYIYYNANKDNLALINIIDDKYIEDKQITQNNLYNYIEEFNNNQVILENKIYRVQDEYELYTYYIYGQIIDINTKKAEDFHLGVRLDTHNYTFSILPYQYMLENDLIDIYEGKSVNNINTSIDKNEYNNYNYIQMTEEKISEKFLEDYIFLAIHLPDEAYNYLDESVKQNKFKDLNSYKKYIEENVDRIKNATLRKYKVNYYDDYTEYIITDNYGYRYIFKEKELLQYTITLE